MWEQWWAPSEARLDYFWASHACKLEIGSFIVWGIVKAEKIQLNVSRPSTKKNPQWSSQFGYKFTVWHSVHLLPLLSQFLIITVCVNHFNFNTATIGLIGDCLHVANSKNNPLMYSYGNFWKTWWSCFLSYLIFLEQLEPPHVVYHQRVDIEEEKLLHGLFPEVKTTKHIFCCILRVRGRFKTLNPSKAATQVTV